jgi:hypothetical protein
MHYDKTVISSDVVLETYSAIKMRFINSFIRRYKTHKLQYSSMKFILHTYFQCTRYFDQYNSEYVAYSKVNTNRTKITNCIEQNSH